MSCPNTRYIARKYPDGTILYCDTVDNKFLDPVADAALIATLSPENCLPDFDSFCKKSSSLYTVIDNTGTRFTWTADMLITWTDGSTSTVQQTPQAGWSQQLNHWVTIFQAALDAKCPKAVAEARCNRPGGCGGLLPPPSELDGLIPTMFWRYMQITACPTCPAINRVQVTSINGVAQNPPRDLVMDYIPGEEKRYIQCVSCVDPTDTKLLYDPLCPPDNAPLDLVVPEADMPLCLFDCSEELPPTPVSACNFELVEICDSENTGQLVYAQFADCGDGETFTGYYTPDPDGALVEYELIGEVLGTGCAECEVLSVETLCDATTCEQVDFIHYTNCPTAGPFVKGTDLPADAKGPFVECKPRVCFKEECVKQETYYYEWDNGYHRYPVTGPRPTRHDTPHGSLLLFNGNPVTGSTPFIDRYLTCGTATIDQINVDGVDLLTAPVVETSTTGTWGKLNILMWTTLTANSQWNLPTGIACDRPPVTPSINCYGRSTSCDDIPADANGDIGYFDVTDCRGDTRRFSIRKTYVGEQKYMRLWYKDCNDRVTCEYINMDTKEVVTGLNEDCLIPCDEVSCGVAMGSCKCYGDSNSVEPYEYTNSDNTTEGSFSMNDTTIKWSVSGGDGSLDGSIPYVDDCINAGGIAKFSIQDTEGNTVNFEADTILQSSPTGAAYTGTGPGGFSGKVRSVTITCCLEGEEGGVACAFLQDDKTVKWFDDTTGVELTAEQVAGLSLCAPEGCVEVCPDCPESLIQIQGCAAEAVADQADVDDLILTIAVQDCEGVILSSKQYNITQGNSELTEPVQTTDCDPEPDVTQTEECITDTQGVEWTEITIVEGLAVTVIYVNQDTLALGTPAGDPSEWKSCAISCQARSDNYCYYVEKEAVIRPYGDAPNYDGLQLATSFAGATLDGCIKGTWETTTPTYGSAPLRFPPGLTNWFVSMFNSGSGIYNNTMRLNMWAEHGCIVESFIRMSDIDDANGTNKGEMYNVSGTHGYTAITEYQMTGSPAYYPFGTYAAIPLNTGGQLQSNGDYVPNATTSGVGLQVVYNGGFTNQVITACTDQGGQSVVWMAVRYLAPVRVEQDCSTGELTFFDDSAYDEQDPYDASGQPKLSTVQLSEKQVVLRPCKAAGGKPECCASAFNPYSDCDVEASLTIRCVDGAQTVTDIDGNPVSLADGDEIAYNVLTCDGTVIGFSIVSINDSTVQIALPAPGQPGDPDPAPFVTKTCDPAPEILGPRCVIDEKENQWVVYDIVSAVTGTTVLYFDANGNPGTPIGDPNNFTDCDVVCNPLVLGPEVCIAYPDTEAGCLKTTSWHDSCTGQRELWQLADGTDVTQLLSDCGIDPTYVPCCGCDVCDAVVVTPTECPTLVTDGVVFTNDVVVRTNGDANNYTLYEDGDDVSFPLMAGPDFLPDMTTCIRVTQSCCLLGLDPTLPLTVRYQVDHFISDGPGQTHTGFNVNPGPGTIVNKWDNAWTATTFGGPEGVREDRWIDVEYTLGDLLGGVCLTTGALGTSNSLSNPYSELDDAVFEVIYSHNVFISPDFIAQWTAVFDQCPCTPSKTRQQTLNRFGLASPGVETADLTAGRLATSTEAEVVAKVNRMADVMTKQIAKREAEYKASFHKATVTKKVKGDVKVETETKGKVDTLDKATGQVQTKGDIQRG